MKKLAALVCGVVLSLGVWGEAAATPPVVTELPNWVNLRENPDGSLYNAAQRITDDNNGNEFLVWVFPDGHASVRIVPHDKTQREAELAVRMDVVGGKIVARWSVYSKKCGWQSTDSKGCD